ncbi:MAG: DUF2249 domain-containing protein [Verrucomicrobiota bacterium]
MKLRHPAHSIDLRTLSPRQQQPAIFKAWGDLADGGTLLLTHDVDMLAVYFRFACEQTGRFHWEYKQSGPEIWEVRVTKGKFAHPGFVPTPDSRAGHTNAPRKNGAGPLVLDVRPMFSRGEAPCDAIDSAVSSLMPGQHFVLLVPFEPAPLYIKLRRQGFDYSSTQMDDGSWRVEFRKAVV